MMTLKEITEAAKAVPNKDWVYEEIPEDEFGFARHSVFNENRIVVHDREWGDEPEVAKHIATASPKTVLELIALVRVQHEALTDATDQLERAVSGDRIDTGKVNQALERDAIKAYNQFGGGE
jgi:hypothetical protein